MKAWKYREGKHKGRIALDGGGTWCTPILAATPTLRTEYNVGNYLYVLKEADEIDILKETWVHPHLLKVYKEKIKKDLENLK